ncbi:hypothetical protein E2C01_065508 [Portunus trituberculatus]|uniref:Uncharacterized protein n=1 Tax=Portunus trituberculatus TaxID=210409 RepID=A0A5B7HMR9_PORTR|nr:hypothetical protein [Portunus trituberculatus]
MAAVAHWAPQWFRVWADTPSAPKALVETNRCKYKGGDDLKAERANTRNPNEHFLMQSALR